MVAIPALVQHGGDHQMVPFATSGRLSRDAVKGAVLTSYPGYPPDILITHADRINADLLAFIEE